MDPRLTGLDWKTSLSALLDLVLPRVCLVCGRPLLPRERHLCTECLADLPETHYATLARNPMADRFNARFHYFYSETCDYDINGPYNCSGVSSMSSPFTIGLKITHDGYASLRLDGDWFYYSESEYSEGDDYYQFYDVYCAEP